MTSSPLQWSLPGAFLALWTFLLTAVLASPPLQSRGIIPGVSGSPYAPQTAKCPSSGLLRTGRTVSPVEQAYVNKRKAKADVSLQKFAAKVGDFPVLSDYPMLGLANGGGGIRGFLTSAGSRMAYDDRETSLNFSTAGLLQAITYEGALSGSSIMLASYAENNEEPTLKLYNSLWKGAMANGLFQPDGETGTGPALAGITADILSKNLTGAPVSIVDALGRLFGYVAFKNDKAGPAGVNKKLSEVLLQPSFKNYEAPIPLFVALGIESDAEGCGLPPMNATQYEFSPFEFGSFDKDIKAFTSMKYMGSILENGKPSTGDLGQSCVTGFDNTNFIVGTSTAVINEDCGQDVTTPIDNLLNKADLKILESIIEPVAGLSQVPLFSFIPNYAYKHAGSPKIQSEPNLMLVDGGENIQVIPIGPFVYRTDVKVLIMTDSSTYSVGNKKIDLPNGRSLVHSAQQAAKQGYGDRFPALPTPKEFLKEGLVRRPTAFGCNLSPDDPGMTIVYLANRKYTYNSAVKTNKDTYTPAESHGLLFNGAQVGTGGNDPQFGFCVTCVMLKRQTEAEGKQLPKGCDKCLKQMCYN